MLKASTAVEEIVLSSEFASEGLSNGCLNLSAYAKTILPLVEAKTKKEVTLGSVIAALSRMNTTNLKGHKPFIPYVEADNLLTRSGLAEIAYVKTPQNQRLVSKLYANPKFTNSQFFVVTAGLSEISIITTEALSEEINKLFAPQKPKLFMKDLASLSMQTSTKGIVTPNQFYAIIRKLALQRINIVEFVTTYTELSFILNENDLKAAFNVLHDSFFASPINQK